MALSEYKAEHRVFALKGGSFQVEGLSLEAFTTLIRTHLPDLEAIFELGAQTMAGKVEITEADITNLVISVAEEAPALASNIIAVASGETDEAAVTAARKLPFPVQVQVLLAVVELTFDEVGGVKKAWESVAGLLKQQSQKMTVSPQ